MTVRTAICRPAAPFVLLLALLVHTAFGLVLACHDTTHDMTHERPLATVAAVTEAPEHGTAECPGCVPGATPDAEGPTRGPAAGELPNPQAETDPCTPDRPCHGPAGSHAAENSAARGFDNPRDPGPALVPACVEPNRAERPVQPAPVPNPMPPAAVLAPVAVLCVDRN